MGIERLIPERVKALFPEPVRAWVYRHRVALFALSLLDNVIAVVLGLDAVFSLF